MISQNVFLSVSICVYTADPAFGAGQSLTKRFKRKKEGWMDCMEVWKVTGGSEEWGGGGVVTWKCCVEVMKKSPPPCPLFVGLISPE